MAQKILIVDDEIETFSFIADTLEDQGYSVVSVDSGPKALQLAQNTFFDVIVLDINMPEMNGIETLTHLKRISPLSTVITMSAALQERIVDQAIALGSFAFITKPFKIDTLIGTIESAVNTTTVLVVDDDQTDASLITDRLEQRGFKSIMVNDGPQALDVLTNNRPDFILLDIKMPGMDGFAVLEKIRKQHPDTPIVMMSAYLRKEHIERSMKMGALTCFQKPLKYESVITAIKTAEESRKQETHDNHILIIDDNESLAENLKYILEEHHYTVTLAHTGNEAIEIASKTRIDALISDYRLPDISGLDTIKIIKEKQPRVVAILITAYGTFDVAVKAIREQVNDFFTKPFDVKVLLRSLERGLSQKP